MPFSCLEAVIVNICSEPTILHNSAISELQNCVPLSDSNWCGALYLPIHANKHVANVLAERSGTGYSSMKRKKGSMMETKYSFPLAFFGKCPVKSIAIFCIISHTSQA